MEIWQLTFMIGTIVGVVWAYVFHWYIYPKLTKSKLVCYRKPCKRA